MKKSLVNSLSSLSLLIALFFVSLSVVFSWFINVYNMKNPILGEINSHFAGGDGSAATPYLITRPEHFFNLAYLQNLGYFNSDSVTYHFEIPNNTLIDFTTSFYQTVPPIGTEAHPFVSIFNGNKSVLKGYTIDGTDRQDIGTFGYVGDGAQITNLFLQTPTIISEQSASFNTTGFHDHNDMIHNIATGYIAGHITTGATISNVYVISPTIRSLANSYANRSQYGLIGYSAVNNGEIPGGPRDKRYSFTFNAGDAYTKLGKAITAYGTTYQVYDDVNKVRTSINLNQAITTAVSINSTYSLSTLKVASAANPTPVYFYDLMKDDPNIGPIGSGDQVYVKENIDVIGPQSISSTELTMNTLSNNIDVPVINAPFNPLAYPQGIILYVKPTNNLEDLGLMTTTKTNNSASMTFAQGWKDGVYQGGISKAVLFNVSKSVSEITMNAANAFTAVKSINGTLTVVDTTMIVPDYYVYLIGKDSSGTLKISSLSFVYIPALLNADALTSISGVDFIDATEISDLQTGATHTFSLLNFGYDLNNFQKLSIDTSKNANVLTDPVDDVYEIRFTYNITDSSFFYIDIINLNNKTVKVYVDQSGTPIYSGTSKTIEVLVQSSGASATGSSP